MIRNDNELAVTRERVAKFERLLEELRKTARPEEWAELQLRLPVGDRANAARDPGLSRPAGPGPQAARRRPDLKALLDVGEHRRAAGLARNALTAS